MKTDGLSLTRRVLCDNPFYTMLNEIKSYNLAIYHLSAIRYFGVSNFTFKTFCSLWQQPEYAPAINLVLIFSIHR